MNNSTFKINANPNLSTESNHSSPIKATPINFSLSALTISRVMPEFEERSPDEKAFLSALNEYQKKSQQPLQFGENFILSVFHNEYCLDSKDFDLQAKDTKGLFSMIAEIFDELGNILTKKGAFSESERCYEKALNIKTQFTQNDNSSFIASYNYFGYLYYLKGRYQCAQEMFSKVLNSFSAKMEIEQEIASEKQNDQVIAQHQNKAYHGMGLVNLSLGNYSIAEQYLKSALTKSNENDDNIAETYQAISRLNICCGNYEEALLYIEYSLEIKMRIYGERHPETLKCFNDLGLILIKLCRFDEAAYKIKITLDILLELLGEMHPEVSRSYHILGVAFRAQGNFKEAIEHQLKALELKTNIYGELHEKIAGSYYEIANTFLIQGLYKEAQDYCLKFEKISTEIFGEEHPMTVLAHIHVKAAYIYLNKQEFDENVDKEELFNELERLLKLQGKLIGENHTDLCLTFIVMGNAYRYTRKYNEGINCFLKALEISIKNQDHYMTAFIHRYLAFIYKLHGGMKDALYHSNKALRIWSNFPLSARAQAFADPDFFAHSISGVNDLNSAVRYAQKAKQIVWASKNEQWRNIAQGAIKTFEKKAAKYELMNDNLF